MPIITERLASQVDRYMKDQGEIEIDVEITITTADGLEQLDVLLVELLAAAAATMRREGWK